MSVLNLPTELRFDTYDLLSHNSNPYHAFHVDPEDYGFRYYRGSSNSPLSCQQCSPSEGGYAGHCSPEVIFNSRFEILALASTCKNLYNELSPLFGRTLTIDFHCNKAHHHTVSTVMKYFAKRFSSECRARVSMVHFYYQWTDPNIDFVSLNLLARRIRSDVPGIKDFTLTISFYHAYSYLDGDALRRAYDDQNRQLWEDCEETLSYFIVEMGRRWQFTIGFDEKRNFCLHATLRKPYDTADPVAHADVGTWRSEPWIQGYVDDLNTIVRPFLAPLGVSDEVLEGTDEMRKMMAGM